MAVLEEELAEIVELINAGEYMKAEQFIASCMEKDPVNCELTYLCGVNYELSGRAELAYYTYKLAIMLAENDEDRHIVEDALNNLSATANVSEYELGKALQRLVTDRIKICEYDKTSDFLRLVLYDRNTVAAKIALSEENMLLYMMLETVLCERNRNADNFRTSNVCVKYGNDVYRFKKDYIALKFIVRRIWFGCDIEGQRELKELIKKLNISDDMLAVVAKYSVTEEYWVDVFEKISHILEDNGAINIYSAWVKTLNLPKQKKCMPASSFENKAEVKRLYYRPDYERNTYVDNNTFSIIFCTNDEIYEKECIRYLKRLYIPEGMELEICSVWDATGMAAGYNYAMNVARGVYKLYIHHDTFVIKQDCLIRLAESFRADEEIGLLGIFGAMDMHESALWYKSRWEDSRLNLYQDAVLNILTSVSECARETIEPAMAVDGVFIATSKDVRWREDLFDGWHYYDISQGYEFRRAGFKTCFISDKSGIWVMHETTMRKDSKDLYGYYRNIFIDNYLKG